MSRCDTHVDVAIIGAGPAGSAAAIELARGGRRVLLIEKQRNGRDKVCGGCLSGPAVRRLQYLLGPDRPLPGVEGVRITFVIGQCRLTGYPNGATRLVARGEFDALLADAAVSAGAQLRYGETATLERGETGWDVLAGGERIGAGTILLACGLSGLPQGLMRKGRCPPARGRHRKRRLIAQKWVQPPEGALPEVGSVELHWLRGGYVGLATPKAEQCVIAFMADAPDDAGESAWGRLRRLNPNALIWTMLPADAPSRYGARGCAGFPWTPQRLGEGNVLLIGDAAGYEEAFSGEGIQQAMCSARCAAQPILEGGAILNRYTSLMSRYHRPVARRARLISSLLRTSFIHSLASRPPGLTRRLLENLVEWVHVRGTL